MISHGRKSHEKCYVEELARRLARFAGRIRRCDEGILRSGRNIMCCCLILEGKIIFHFRRSQH